MIACFRGNREELYGEVLLLDERKLMLTGIKKSWKAAAILQQVFSHLDLEEGGRFFGLRFCDDRQQTLWLDPSKTLSQHRLLIGPPYIFYFGVKFYVEDPTKLKDETTRFQFYLQLRQDVRRGRLLCPAHLRPRLDALLLQAERGDLSDDDSSEPQKQEVQLIYKSLRGVSCLQAQTLVLSLCSSLQMYGVSLFAAYGENQTEYFLGPTPVGVVIYRNKELVGKYFWPRITKLHFKDDMFELRVFGKNGSETSFFFQTSDRCDCKRLWRCCVEHHTFFRMSQSDPQTHKLKLKSAACSPSAALPQLTPVNKTTTTTTTTTTAVAANQSLEPVMKQTAPPAAHRSGGGTKPEQGRPSAPWENSGTTRGLFNPKFPPNTREEEQDGGRPTRRSRSLDGDRPIRAQRRRSRSHGNTSSGSESEKSNSERRRRRTKSRGRHGDRGPDSASHCRARSHSPDARTWKHIQKQLVEPDGVIDRQTEEIPYKEVRVSGEPIRMRRSPRGRRHHQQWASASQLQSKMVPPLPVTTATDTSCRVPTNH